MPMATKPSESVIVTRTATRLPAAHASWNPLSKRGKGAAAHARRHVSLHHGIECEFARSRRQAYAARQHHGQGPVDSPN